MIVNPRFVFIPSVRRGNGTGHLKRALSLAEKTGGTISVPLRADQELPWQREASRAGVGVTDTEKAVAVVDYRETPRKLLDLLPSSTTTLGVDEGGDFRRDFDYLIDTFPRLKGKGEANRRTLPLVEPVRREGRAEDGKRGGILLAFGGEDAAGLTEKVYRALVVGISPERITLLRGSMAERRETAGGPESASAGPEILDAPENLSRLLHRYETVITHFGLTAYEAADAGCRVITVNPGGYHQRLARAAGFPAGPYMTLRIPGSFARRRAYKSLRRVIEKAAGGPNLGGEGGRVYLESAVESFAPPRRRSCPVCGSRDRDRPVRFPRRTYFRCPRCGVTYLLSFSGERREYGEEYFFSEYKRQYGRTYLEDLPRIVELSRPRAAVLKLLIGEGSVLDVGCAYGGFLRAARDRGFEVYGTDISESAVRYIRETSGMPASASPFHLFDPLKAFKTEKFDALTLWFVLEHFEDTDEVLKRCAAMIKAGGVLALSVPNGAGISARKDRRSFLENSPGDHKTVWTPRSASRVLRRFGFSTERIRVTGHHPERFPGASGIESSSFLFRLLRGVSVVLRFGDTFEIYARKTGRNG